MKTIDNDDGSTTVEISGNEAVIVVRFDNNDDMKMLADIFYAPAMEVEVKNIRSVDGKFLNEQWRNGYFSAIHQYLGSEYFIRRLIKFAPQSTGGDWFRFLLK